MAARLSTFRKWLQTHQHSMEHILELEMWLKSFERYFAISNLPLTEEERKEANFRDYSEELKIGGDVIFRVSQVCAVILPEEKVSYSSFAKYLDTSIRQASVTDRFTTNLRKQNWPDESLNFLMEALLDIRTIILELSGLSKLPYLCFAGIGKVIARELGNSAYIEFFLQRRYVPLYDQIANPKIIHIIRSIQVGESRRTIAALFLDFFRALRYLKFLATHTQDAQTLKRSLVLFSLLYADLRVLIRHMEDEFVKNEHPDKHFVDLVQNSTYSLSMELKKVMQRELVGAASLQQYALIYTKIQNSEGILTNAIQQILFSLANYFDPSLAGADLFPDYVTKLEQAIQLREDLKELLEYSRTFQAARDFRRASGLVRKIEGFRSTSMKYLMFKDWMNFDNFYHEIAACKTSGSLAISLRGFIALLSTLLKEVSKRAILQKT